MCMWFIISHYFIEACKLLFVCMKFWLGKCQFVFSILQSRMLVKWDFKMFRFLVLFVMCICLCLCLIFMNLNLFRERSEGGCKKCFEFPTKVLFSLEDKAAFWPGSHVSYNAKIRSWASFIWLQRMIYVPYWSYSNSVLHFRCPSWLRSCTQVND